MCRARQCLCSPPAAPRLSSPQAHLKLKFPKCLFGIQWAASVISGEKRALEEKTTREMPPALSTGSCATANFILVSDIDSSLATAGLITADKTFLFLHKCSVHFALWLDPCRSISIATGCSVFHTLCVFRTLLLPTKAMEKRLEAKPSISSWFLSRYCLGKAVRELGILQLFYLCTCLCALCSSAGDSSVLSGTVCMVFLWSLSLLLT